MKKERHFGLRIDDELLRKFHYVCDYNGRSANGQILYLIRKCIKEFETSEGEIEIEVKYEKQEK